MGGRGGSSGSASGAGTITTGSGAASLNTTTNRTGSGPRFDRYEIGASSPGFAGGETFGRLEVTHDKQGGTVEVRSIDAGIRGQGIGERLYATGIERAQKLGAKQFNSDSRVSPSAQRAWERMSAKLPGAVTKTQGPNGPMYSVDLGKVTRAALGKLKRGE